MTEQMRITQWEKKLCTLWGMANSSNDPVISFSMLSQELYGAFTFEVDEERAETLNFLIYISDGIISSYTKNKGRPKTPFRDVKTSPWAVIGSSACTAPLV